MKTLTVVYMALCIFILFAPVYIMLISPDFFTVKMVFAMIFALANIIVLTGWNVYSAAKGWE